MTTNHADSWPKKGGKGQAVSVLITCLDAGQFLEEAITSVLQQQECLEVIITGGKPTDVNLKMLKAVSSKDSRVRIVSLSETNLADAFNKAFQATRGTMICWLNGNELIPPGAFLRALVALDTHPEWLMVYGEGEEFNAETSLNRRYPTLPPSIGIEGFRSHCFVCQPSVVFRRSIGILLGKFNQNWRMACDFDFFLRAFKAFPHRIGYMPHLQCRTRLHRVGIKDDQRAQWVLEATQLLKQYFDTADTKHLHNYASELQLEIKEKHESVWVHTKLQQLFELARPSLSPDAWTELQRTWLTGDPPKPPYSEPCSWRLTTLQPAAPIDVVPIAQRPFGVNLIGHAFDIFGIGEDIRMAARALQAVDVPFCVINHPADNGSSSLDRSLESLICTDPEGGPYAFNLVCMAAPIQARWLSQVGCDPLRERYTISSWPWETQKWPDAWLPLLNVADELWPSSTFTASALTGALSKTGKSLQIMPMAAEISSPERFCNAAIRASTRKNFGIPADTVLFGYGFDLNSTAIRKNPMGALEAFQLAFPLPHLPAAFGRKCSFHPLSEQVSLMIKTFPPRSFSAEWEWLRARAEEDPRIILIAESLQRDELLSLFGCCDVFLSLHRSEGFGRGMAEALQLGVDVIATDFGGNTDFCTGPLAHPVRWRKAPIPHGSYPFADGHNWAEPDLFHAAQLCQKVASGRLEATFQTEESRANREKQVLANYREQFSFSACGNRYRKRLQQIWKHLSDGEE